MAQPGVSYVYGDNPGAPTDFSQNSWGRLAEVTFGSGGPGDNSFSPYFNYLYSYTLSGRVARQRMHGAGDLDAFYGWDNEGKMTSMVSPGGGAGGDLPMQYLYSYDPMGRLNGMMEISCPSQTVTQSPCTSNHGPTVATASYGPAGEITGVKL